MRCLLFCYDYTRTAKHQQKIYDKFIFIFTELLPCFIKVTFKMLQSFLLKRTIKTLYNNKILSIQIILMGRSCHLEEVSLGKIFLKIRSKFSVENPCQSAISIKSESNFVLITLEHGCSPVNLLHIFIFSRTTLDVCIWLGMI